MVGAIGRGVAVVVNFFASLPGRRARLRAGTLNSRVPATLLIALGGFIPGWTSGLNRFGVTWSFFLGELLGVVLIFLGFLVSIEVFSDIRLPFTRIVLARREQQPARAPERLVDIRAVPSLESSHFPRRPALMSAWPYPQRRPIGAERMTGMIVAKAENRPVIALACTTCKERTYSTRKNKRNDPGRMELNKFCPRCRQHTLHRETK